MHLSSAIVSSVLLAGAALAQYGSSPASGYSSTSSSSQSSSSSSSGQVSVQVVKVSNKGGSLTFSPNNIQAAVGSMVQFQFYPKNHSVVQSTFDKPCIPINNVQSNVTGFFSGFMPVSNATDALMPMYTVMVNSTAPVWFYCSQAKHCQAGMVGVINAPAANQSRTVETFAALAKSVPMSLSPGESVASTSSSNSTTGSTGSTGSASSTGSSSNGTSTITGGISVSTTSAASSTIFSSSLQVLISVGLSGVIAAFVALVL